MVEEAKIWKYQKGFLLIWHTMIWVLWKVRNDRIFNGRIVTIDEIFEQWWATYTIVWACPYTINFNLVYNDVICPHC